MTSTSAILTKPGQITKLNQLYDNARSQDQTQKGVWRAVYDQLYEDVSVLNGYGDAPRDDVAVDPQTWLWLKGARFVNAGEGAFADLIRDYTINQFKIRYNQVPSDAQMNQASNEIAAAFLGQWLGRNPLLGATQPTLRETGVFDAGAAAGTVFAKYADGTPNGDGNNVAGWAGAILFPNLGGDEFYRNLILDAMESPTSKGVFDELKTVDTGSYDAVAAAAALEKFAEPFMPNVPTGFDALNAVLRQFLSNVINVAVLEIQTDLKFWELYGLGIGDPRPRIGADTLGTSGIQTAINFQKDAHYAAGSKECDVIGYRAAANGMYATGTAYWKRVLALAFPQGTIGFQRGDVINAGRGNDIVYGTSGSDVLDGGEGANTLIYTPASWSGLLDRLYFSFDGKGKFPDRTVIDKWSLSGLLVTQERDIAVEFSKLVIDYQQNQVEDPFSPSGMTEVTDKLDAPKITAILSGSSFKNGEALNRSERVTIEGDLHKSRGANVSIDLGGSPDVAFHQDVIDASAVTHGVKIDLRDGRVRATDQWDISTASKIYITNANEATGTKYDDVLIGSSGKQQRDASNNIIAGEGFSVLYGGNGNDLLVGAGWESHLYGGSGADHFELGANSWVEDGTTDEGDSVSYIGIPLFGGVSQWWNEGGFAYWAGFSSLTAAFPVIGSELLYTAAFFVDAITMKFVRYRLDADGTLEMNFGWGQAGQAAVRNYSLDLDSGKGTAGIAVFSANRVEDQRKGNTLDRIGRFVNLALYAGFGHGAGGIDPLVLDLDGDGYQLTTEVNSDIWFDFNHSGFAQHTGWVRGSDGFLARDLNGNGKIDDVSELLGSPSQGGFDMLAGFDANADGQITAADAVYATLRVWQDLNQNGVTDSGELKSLSDLGIVSIGLATTTPGTPTAIGRNQIARESSFTLASGVTRKIADVVFDVSNTNTRYLGDTTVSAAAAALPQLTGFGTLKDLRVAMTQDAALRGQVASFVADASTDLAALKNGAEGVLYAWAGVQATAATVLGQHGFDARKLAFLEKYAGIQLMPRDAQGLPLLDNVEEMEAMWADQVTRLTLRLAVQGPMAAAFAEITYRPDLDLLVASNPTALADILRRVIAGLPAGDHAAAAAQWAAWAPLLGALTESMVRSDANTVRVDFLFQQLLRAADSVAQPLSLDELASGLGIENLKLGTTGAESLTRGSASGTAVYYGAGGDDVLTGGGGQDVYVFGRQIGHVVVNDNEPNPAGDRIRFAFHSAADVAMSRDGNDLVLTIKATGETIRVTGQFAPVVPLGSDVLLSSNKGIEDIQFADGTIAEIPEIMAAVGMGSDGDDHLVGTMHSDLLTGGKGDDLLEGGDDADLYVVNAGDGHDIIREAQTTPLLRGADMVVFGDGLAPEDLVMSRLGVNGDDLLFTVTETGQTLLIQNQFGYSVLGYNASLALNTRIELFAFRDYAGGWSIKDVQQKLIAQSSTDGDDTILGFGDDDVIDGGRGNDTLVGFDGQDTYRWGKGDGNDVIDERAQYIDVSVGLGGLSLVARADTVEFKDLNRQDLVFARPTAAANLVITDTITGETLTVYRQFDGFQTGVLGAQWFNRVEWFQFADGTRLSWQDVELLVTTGGDGNDSLYGDILADRMAGGRGDDVLAGGGGGDLYIFNRGDGHDTIADGDTSFLGPGFLTIDGTPDVLQFGAGITSSDIDFGRNGTSVDLILRGTNDRVTLTGQDDYIYTGVFGTLSYYRVEEIHFADGEVWTWHDLNQRMIAAATTAGDDLTLGTSTDDVFAASAGNDILDGGDGNDTYAFGRGSGHDVIRDHVDNVLDGDDDRLVFGPGITLADLGFSEIGDDLIITILDTGDTMRIEGQFGWSAWYTWHDVETFAFAGGSTITKTDIERKLTTGTSGNDVICGFSSNDIYQGGAGDDVLIDRDGNDTYIFNRGDGHDTIQEHVDYVLLGDEDTLRFGVGILPSDIVLSRSGNDLTVAIAGTKDAVTIAGQFAMSAWFTWNDIEHFVFANGTEWTKNDVSKMLLTGTSGNDVMIGTGGNDYLDGGAGNDELRGGDGSDTYVFGRGYGQDIIYESLDYVLLGDDDQLIFNADVAPSDLLYVRDGNNLIVRIVGTDDFITIVGEFAVQTPYTWTDVERFVFADGTIITKDEVRQKVLAGTSGDDHIVGFYSNDTLDGGAGNDVLEGLDGSDTYRFGVGDGHDIILENLDDGRSSEEDTLSFKQGVAPSDVRVTREGQDAVFTLASGDSIRVVGQFNQGYNEFLSFNDVEHVVFADGTEWGKADIAQQALNGAATNGNDVLLGSWYGSTYEGKSGDDELHGDGGDDTYVYRPGDGNDLIFDDSGNDRIVFGAGIAVADLVIAGDPADGNVMVIRFANRSGSIRVPAQWLGDSSIDSIQFADGTVMSGAQIAAAFIGSQTTPGNDVIWGSKGSDVIAGGSGDDMLYGKGGDDIYRFGRGDGHDIIFDRGQQQTFGFIDGGNDRIELGVGIAPSDIDVFEPSAEDITLRIRDTGESITILGAVGDGGRRIEQVLFADGTVWSAGELLRRALIGGAGNDPLYGGPDGDILDGGAGDDLLAGNKGDDVYRFGRGDGADTILDRGDQYWWGFSDGGYDAVEMKAGVSPNDVDVIATGPDDIILKIRGTNDQLTLSGQVSDVGRRMEEVRFTDGTKWTVADLRVRSLAPTPGDDVHYAGATSAILEGGAGNDTLYGSPQADILDGGTDNDFLAGNDGDDVYRFGRGDGADVILDRGPQFWWGFGGGGYDAVELRAGISPADLDVVETGPDDIVIKIRGTNDQLTLSGQISDEARRIEEFRFANGTIWTAADLLARALAPTPGDDVHYAGYIGSLMAGGAGNDQLYGSGGNDILDGGTGSDYLDGGSGGNDIYRFGRGDGSDTIVDHGPQYWWGFADGGYDVVELRTGVTPSDVVMLRSGDDLVLAIWGSADRLTIARALVDSAFKIEEVRFTDGTIWTYDDLIARSAAPPTGVPGLSLQGSAGADRLIGGNASEIFVGGRGDDYLEGQAGSDEYRYASGDGNDVIADVANATDTDVLKLTDLTAAQVEFTRSGDDLFVRDVATGQQIKVNHQFAPDGNWGVEQIIFSDGSTINKAQFDARISRATNGNDRLEGSEAADNMRGLAGDDTIRGFAGNDALDGGDGADLLVGGLGNDTLIGGAGDDRLYGDEDTPVAATGQNLLVNGSFEFSGQVVGSWEDGIFNATMPGWTKLNAQVWEQIYSGRAGVAASDGGFWVDLDSGGGGGSNMDISQTVTGLAAGQQLVLAFDHIGRTFNSSSDFEVRWNGVVVGTYRDYGTTLKTDRVILTAAAGDNVVEFIGLGDEDNRGASLDNVRLFPTASPAAGADILNGGDGNDVLVGGLGDDTLAGDAGDDQIFGDFERAYQTSGSNLLVNGSFEVSGQIAGYWGDGIFNTTMPGWTKLNSQVWEQIYSGQGGVAASDGGFWVDLDSGGGAGSNMDIQQAVSGLVAGQQLLLSFDHIGRRADSTTDFEVRWNGTVIGTYTDRGSVMKTDQVLVTAIAGDNIVEFVGLGAQDDTGASLDNVRLFAAMPVTEGGADVLAGGTGNDTLTGGFGDDTYKFDRGDGQDIVVERAGQGSDRVLFGAAIAPSQVAASGPGNGDILLVISGTSDQLLLKGDGGDNAVEIIQFSDGTTWSLATLMDQFYPRNAPPTIDGGTTSSGTTSERSATTGSNSNDTAAGAILFRDPNPADQHSITLLDVSSVGTDAGLPNHATLLAWLSVGTIVDPNGNTAGSVPWSFAAPDSAFDYLRAGEAVVLTYALRLSDGQGGTLAQNVVVTVTGTNDAPLVAMGTVATGGIVELAGIAGAATSDSVTGAIKYLDADSGDTHLGSIASVAAAGATGGLPSNATLIAMMTLGALTEQAGAISGSLPWTFAAADKAFDYLSAGEIVTLTYQAHIADGQGGTLAQPLTVTITGTNDVPTVVSGTTATATVNEIAGVTGSTANDQASGVIRFTDLDLSDTHTASISSVAATGAASGLPANATLLTWLSKGALVEQSGATAGSLPWAFTAPDASFDYLRAGQTATLTYVVQVFDGKGGVLGQNVVVTVTGTNDAPVIASGTSAFGTLTELAAIGNSTTVDTVSGPIKFADADIGDTHMASVISVAASGVTSGLPANAALLAMVSLGAITEPSGSTSGTIGWTFAATDKTFDYLAAGETVTLTYQVLVADGQGAATTQSVAVTVTGTNDAPTIATGTSTTGSIAELSATTASSANDTASGVVRFTDLDLSDTHSTLIAGVTASGATVGLPTNATLLSWLSKGALVEQNGAAAGSLPWAFAAPDSAFDYLRAGQTATLTYAVQLADGRGGAVTQNVAVTITGTNDLPTIAAGTTASGSLTEIASTAVSNTVDTVSGAIKFGDIDLGDTHTASLASVAASGVTAGLPANAALLAMTSLGTVTEPSGSIPGAIGWTFSAADKTFDFLAAGEAVTLTYQVQIADGQGGTLAQSITVTVTGTNDAPAIAVGTGATGSITELATTTGSAANDTATGVIRFTDLDLTDTHSASITGVTASGVTAGLPANATLLGLLSRGTLVEQSGATAGSLSWAFAAPDSTFDYLRAGQTATLTYAVQLTDGKGGSVSKNVAVTITGTNDVPTITAGSTTSAALTEIAGTAASTTADTASGTIKFGDADTGDIHSVSVASVTASGVTAGLPATAALLAMASLGAVTEPSGATPGAVGWTFSAADKTFDYLAAGDTVTLIYQVQIADGQGGTLVQSVAVTVSGTNDGPTIAAGTGATGAITELSMATGSTASDTASGVIRFADLDLTDTHSGSITGVVASGVTAGLPANTTLLAWLSKGALVEQSGAIAGSLPWTFTAPDASFDYLRAGQTATLTYAVQLADGKGGSVTQNIAVTVTGTNDVPTIATGTIASAALNEIAGAAASATADTASGTVKFADADAGDTHIASVASVAATGVNAGLPANATLLAMVTLGTLTDSTSSAAGSVGWTFTAADKTFDYLAAGETVTLMYQVQVSDGQGGVLTQPVAITVTGTNDAVAIAAGTTASGSVTEVASTTGSSANDTTSGTIKFTDLDASDVHAATIASVAATGVTSGLPANATLLAWLGKGTITEQSGSTPGSLPWAFAAPDSAFDYLGAAQTATLTYVVQLADGKGGSASQNIVITITGTNDAPLVVVPGAQIARTSTATQITGVSIGDPDANAANETVTLTTTLGTVAATATSGATVTGSASKSLTVAGTIAQVNATLATLIYTSASAGSDTISVATSDGTVTTTKPIAVTTSATANHGPVIDGMTIASGSVAELASAYGSTTNDTATGTIRFTDADVPDTHTVAVSSVTATGVTSGLPANATLLGYIGKGSVTEPSGTIPGAVTWTFAAPDKTFDYLGAGQTTTLTYVVTVTDNKSAVVTQSVTITVTGTNDGAVLATGATTTGAITELASTFASSTNDTASGTVKFTDEPGDTHSSAITGVAASGTVTGLPASATMLAWLAKGALTEQSGATPGSLPWSFAAPDSAFDYLSAGQTATLTYTIQITDNAGAVMNQSVVVTVTGTNDTPTAAPKSGYTTDNWTALTITGATLLAGATEPDKGDTLTLASVQGASGGTVALTSGNAVFTPTATITGPASFTYSIADGNGGTSTATAGLTVTLHQTNGTSGADTITGTAGKKAQINGLAGNDTIIAGSAGDVLVGGAGDDTLTGAAGIDTFVYNAGFGKDVINSFTATGASHDIIQVDKTLFANWSYLLGATRQVGTDLVITYDTANTVTLKNVALANFTSADAAFV